MSERRDWYYPNVCMPFLGDTSEDIVQSLISKIKDSVMSIVLEDEIFKQRSESLKGRYWYWEDIINFQFSFQPNMDKGADFCRLTLNVGELKNYFVELSPREQAKMLAKKLANDIWKLFQENQTNCRVSVQIEYSTESISSVGTPEYPSDVKQIEYQKVEVHIEKK